jgi:hypothetical protein
MWLAFLIKEALWLQAIGLPKSLLDQKGKPH